MKRSELKRGRGLRRHRKRRPVELGRRQWKIPHKGWCGACQRPGWVIRHHVTYEQHVRREGGNPWDLRNAMDIGTACDCHELHHKATRRIQLKSVPDDAIDFAFELMGEAAYFYLRRRYDGLDVRCEVAMEALAV